MSYRLKLTRPGGETRRLTFSAQPSWVNLGEKIASLFTIQSNAVAVSYEDSDGDIVTMSSQEELQDYFQTCYKPGQLAKLTVINKAQSRRLTQQNTSALVEDTDEGVEGGIPTMGPTMFIEVDDGGWQRLPPVPEIFSIVGEDGQTGPGEEHAFVEVVDTDTWSSKKDSDPASGEHTPKNNLSAHQLRHKGKQKASPRSEATKSTSLASVVDSDFPAKLPVHVYDVSDVGRSRRGSVQDQIERTSFGGPGVDNLMGSFGTVFPASPPQDAFRQVPRASEFHGASEHEPFQSSASISTDFVRPGQMPSLDLEDLPLGPIGTGGSRTPTFEQTSTRQPSFVHDIADLVDNLTAIFASHPELSEGVRDIARNAVGGRYWNTERDRIANVADNVRVAAEETSAHISQVARSTANDAERDAVHMIAASLGGVFRVIGELSASEAGNSAQGRSAPSAARPPSPSIPRYQQPFPPPHRLAHRHGSRAGWNDQLQQQPPGHRQGPWGPSHHISHYVPGQGSGDRPPELRTRDLEQMVDQAQRSNIWGPGSYAPYYYGGPTYDNTHGEANNPNIHETKAQLEAAKAIYKAEKERFRKEKEERRRERHEIVDRRAEQGRAQCPDGTIREEQIITRLPLRGPPRAGRTKQPHAEVPAGQAHLSPAASSVLSASHAPPSQTTQLLSPRGPAADSSTYFAVDPIPLVPPIPPVPVPAPADIVPPVLSAPPVPPARPSAFISWSSLPLSNVAQSLPPPVPSQPTRAASAPGPFSWPAPPVRDYSLRAQLTTLRDRILARLFDMGIKPVSQPDMMDIVNECTSRDDAPDDDEVLADILSTLNIRGSPSPRVGGSGFTY